jgi:hypothetical protein
MPTRSACRFLGYASTTTPMAAYPERVLASGESMSTVMLDNRTTLVDAHNMTVEDFGLPVNLMIATVLADSGTVFFLRPRSDHGRGGLSAHVNYGGSSARSISGQGCFTPDIGILVPEKEQHVIIKRPPTPARGVGIERIHILHRPIPCRQRV